MREIKFRAWDKTNNEWYMGGDTFNLEYSGSYGDFFFDNDHPANMREVKLVWCQFTGIKGRGGFEIYEDDLLRDEQGNVGRVFYHGTGYAVNWHRKDGSWDTDNCLEYGAVVGNIHENPELIED